MTAEIGCPITLSRFAQAAMPPAVAASVAGVAAGFHWTEEIANSLVVRDPVGEFAAATRPVGCVTAAVLIEARPSRSEIWGGVTRVSTEIAETNAAVIGSGRTRV